MNCNDFLPALETGGFVRRIQARRHAARCPRCAAVRAALAAVKRQLAAAEPLSPRARKLWEQALQGEPALRPARRKVFLPAAVGLAAAACILLLVLEIALQKKTDSPRLNPEIARSDSRPTDKTVVSEIDPAGGLSQLAASVDRLDAELQTLRLKAERAEAQRQIAATLDRFAHW